MNNEVSNALIASYPDAINFKETESYKSFYDVINKQWNLTCLTLNKMINKVLYTFNVVMLGQMM